MLLESKPRALMVDKGDPSPKVTRPRPSVGAIAYVEEGAPEGGDATKGMAGEAPFDAPSPSAPRVPTVTPTTAGIMSARATEFLAAIAATSLPDRLLKAFDAIDGNGNGVIELDEVRPPEAARREVTLGHSFLSRVCVAVWRFASESNRGCSRITTTRRQHERPSTRRHTPALRARLL